MQFSLHRLSVLHKAADLQKTAAACVILLFLLTIIAGGLHAAESNVAVEYRVKSGFIYNFAIFIDWPKTSFDDRNEPFRVAVVDMAVLGDTFNDLATKRVKGRNIEVYAYKDDGSTPPPHILFMNTPDTSLLDKLIGRYKNTSVLTVGQTRGFARRGGVINILKTNNKFSLEINMRAAKRAGLKISSRLLKLKRTSIIE